MSIGRPAAFLAAATFALAACGGSSGPVATQPPGSLLVTANLNVFSPAAVQAPADEAFTVWFENKENVPHNVKVVDSAGAVQGEAGPIFNGPAAQPLQIPALAAGTYSILCEVHPDMHSELVAQ